MTEEPVKNISTGEKVENEEDEADELAPATDIWITSKQDGVRLRMTDSGHGSVKPMTIHSLLQSKAEKCPNNLAMAVKRGADWTKWTYKEYFMDLKKTAKGFIKLGLDPYHGVSLLGFNSPEWIMADIGAILAGGFAVGLYTTNTPEACEYIANNSESNVIVVENDAQLQKILKIRSNLPYLKAIIQYTGELAEKQDNIFTWKEFMELHNDIPDSALEERLKMQAPNKCCTIIYTSGTTGVPKGVMLSHDNLIWTAAVTSETLGLIHDKERVISFLPLGHIAAQILDIFLPMYNGSPVYFAQPDALKGSLGTTLQEVRPTYFFAVPRVWEKMREKMEMLQTQQSLLKKKITDWARRKGLESANQKMNGNPPPIGLGLANMLVFNKARASLGLDQAHIILSGSAPISEETMKFFHSWNIALQQVYGESENTGPHTFGLQKKFRFDSVGSGMIGVETKIAEPDEEGNGEICVKGRHVFMGYLNMEENTRETIDGDGWLHTGDIGKLIDGFIYMTGRIKEIIITEGGENVAPVLMENSVKATLPVINNCMLVGDKQKYVALLICIRTEVDPVTTAPKDKLSADVLEWCRSLDCTATTVSELRQNQYQAVQDAIQTGIDLANEKAPSRVAQIKKWTVLPADFSIPGGELGPTLKLKRHQVLQKYRDLIDEMYSEN